MLLLAVCSVAQSNDDFAGITSWCWGYVHGASEELLMVHGYPFIGVMAADSVASPSRNWVSRIFDRVTTHRPFPCRSTWCFFVFLHHHFHVYDAPCFTDSAFTPHTPHLQVKWVHWLNDGRAAVDCFSYFMFFVCLKLWVNAVCGSCCATLSWTWSVDYVIMYALVAV